MKIAISIFLVVSTFAVYSQVQDHEFINFDDDLYITDNLNVQAGLTRESVKWAFTTLHFGNLHPMTWLSHMLDYQLYGLNPKGHHLTNLFFHIANTLILFTVLLRMTGALWQCGFVAAMFALHPFNVESVAWVAERKNVLSTFFWLLTMWAYIHYVEKSSIKRYGLVVLFFALGLMSKPMLVTLPFVLLLMDYWPLGRLKFGQERGGNEITGKYTNKRSDILHLVREKIPLFLLAAGSSIVTLIVPKISSVVQSIDLFPLQARLTNAMVSYLEYMEKMIWPDGLAVFYPHPGNDLVLWKGILCGVALVAITAISVRFIKKAPYFAVGWFWFLGTLVPVIGIVQVGMHAMADRYTYVPFVGIFIIVAWGLPELMAKWRYKERVLFISTGILIPVLMMITWVQVGHWKNSITIFKHAIRATDKNALAHNNLGMALFVKGETEEAISHYNIAIKLKPGFAMAHSNLGVARYVAQKTEEAILHYRTAIKLDPDFTPAHYNLGNALLDDRKSEEAIPHYKKAITLKPDYALAHNSLGKALFAIGKTEEAISHYKTAIKLKPDYALAHYNLGNAFLAIRENGEAISYYKMAIKLKPDFVEPHVNLGNVFLIIRETETAISHYKMAIKLKPDLVLAHYNLGKALFVIGETEKAISHYKVVVKLKPDYADAHHNLKIALLRLGENERFKTFPSP